MNTGLDAASQLFLENVQRIQQRLGQASQEASSGKKVTRPSDDPDQIGTLLQLRAAQHHNQQIQANLSLAATGAEAADTAIASCIQLMDRAVSLGTQGATSASNVDYQSLSQEVQAILDEMVGYSQTTVQGHYIFSGDRDQSPAYGVNHAAANGVVQLSSAPATAQIEDPSGRTIPAGLNAQNIFDARNADGTAASGNVFAALSALRTALSAGNVDAVTSALEAVKTASTHLNRMESFYGNVERQIQSAQSLSTRQDTQYETEISQIQDADVAEAALVLTQAQTQLQAAFQMRAGMPHRSLFDYLG